MYYEQLLRRICGCQAALPWGTCTNCLAVLQRCGKIIYYFNTLTDCLKSINTLDIACRSWTRQFPVVGGPRAFAQSNNFDDSAEAIYRMIQVFSHVQNGLQPISWPVIGFTLNVSGFFHVWVFTHPKAHLHFALLANAQNDCASSSF